jgi:hypothetical protein
MATVIEGYTTEEQRFLVGSLWSKGLNAKGIHKEMFPVYGRECSSRKAVHNWVEKFSQGRLKVADDARQGVEVAETIVERFLCCAFRRIAKATAEVYQCWWRICREITAFILSSFEYHMLYVLYPFVTYLLTLPRSMWFQKKDSTGVY